MSTSGAIAERTIRGRVKSQAPAFLLSARAPDGRSFGATPVVAWLRPAEWCIGSSVSVSPPMATVTA